MTDSLIVKKAIRASKKIDLLDSIDDPELKILRDQKGDMGKFSKTYHQLLSQTEKDISNLKERLAILKKIRKTYTIEPIEKSDEPVELVTEDPIPITKKEDVAINDLIQIKDDSFAFLLINKGSMTTKIDIVKSIISYIGKNSLFINGSKVHYAPDEKLMILLGGDEDEYSIFKLLRQVESRFKTT